MERSGPVLYGAGGAREHVLVCVSSSPYCARVIGEASRMAELYDAVFTALYVGALPIESLSDRDGKRLTDNLALAESLGAKIVTINGTDVPSQIAEYVRISGVTRVIIGHSATLKNRFSRASTLTDRLVERAPNADIVIVPEAASENENLLAKKSFFTVSTSEPQDFFYTVLIMAVSAGVAYLTKILGLGPDNTMMIFLLGSVMASLVTKSLAGSMLASLLGAVEAFLIGGTTPGMTYPITYFLMLGASVAAGSMASRLSEQASRSSGDAFRTRILFDTNRQLVKGESESHIISVMGSQIAKLLGRSVLVYPVADSVVGKHVFFPSENDGGVCPEEAEGKLLEMAETTARDMVRTGTGSSVMPESPYMFLPVHSSDTCYAVVCVYSGTVPPDPFEFSVLISIIGECAMAIGNQLTLEKKILSDRKAEEAVMRSNILRSISHDLRTPLTSITGNAANLLHDGGMLDEETKKQMYSDIFDESLWLAGIVENLLSVTRFENESVRLNITAELVEDVVMEAMKHVSRNISRHELIIDMPDEPLLAMMDTRLISQVMINLVNNAVKYTQDGSVIRIGASESGGCVSISVSDNGPGIPEADRERVFELFYSGDKKTNDSNRSMGLGLALCRSIVRAHGGDLTLKANVPSGCVFTFTLPSYKEEIHE